MHENTDRFLAVSLYSRCVKHVHLTSKLFNLYTQLCRNKNTQVDYVYSPRSAIPKARRFTLNPAIQSACFFLNAVDAVIDKLGHSDLLRY